MRSAFLAITLALANVLLIARAAPCVPELVMPDGSPVGEAELVCDQVVCWARVPGLVPQQVGNADDPELVLQPPLPVHLLLLDGRTGEPIVAGTGRWLVPGIPAQLATMSWSASGGRLDLGAADGTKIELEAPGFRSASVELQAGPTRRSVVMDPIASLEIVAEPAVEGELVLWALEDMNPFSTLAKIAQRHELKAGTARADDLSPERTWIGAVLLHDHVPVPLTVETLPARLELELEQGLQLVGRVVDPAGAPIPGGRVVVSGVLPEPHQIRYSQEARADAEGQFTITGLLAGSARIEACAEGHSCTQQTLELDASAAEASRELVLPPGLDLTLRLVDRDGIPLADVCVHARGSRLASDESGTVVIPGVARGQSIELSARGGEAVPWRGAITVKGSPQVLELERGASLSWPVLLPEGVSANAQVFWERSRPEDHQPLDSGSGSWDNKAGLATAVGLRPGRVQMKLDIDGFARLQSEPVDLRQGESVVLPPIVPDQGGALSGKVVDGATGEPVPGARLTLLRGMPGSYRPPKQAERALSAVSDEDGSFRVTGLGDGPYRLRAEAPGFAATVVDGVEPGAMLDPVELGVGLTVTGHVLDRQGEPLGGARVAVWEPAPYAYEPEASTIAARDGSFRLELLPVGEWRLEVASRELLARRDVSGDETDVLEVELQLGGTRLEGVVLIGEAPAGRGTLVLRPPGALAGPVVMLQRGSNQRFFGLPGQPLKAAVSEQGQFEVMAVDPGLWIARYSPDSGASTGSEVEVVVPDVERHSCIVQLPGGSLHGRVVDLDDQPVSGARINMTSGPTLLVAFADPQGSFSFTGVAPGNARLHASAQGYGDAEPVLVDVPDGGAAEQVTLALRPSDGGTIEARVRTARGSVGGASAMLFGPSGGGRFLASDGTARWESLEPGSYRLCARAYDGPVGCSESVRVDGDTVPLQLELGRGGWVAAPQVDDDADLPIAQLALADGTDLSGLAFLGNPPRITADGPVMLGPMSSGRYSVRVTTSGGEMTGMVDVRDDDVVELWR